MVVSQKIITELHKNHYELDEIALLGEEKDIKYEPAQCAICQIVRRLPFHHEVPAWLYNKNKDAWGKDCKEKGIDVCRGCHRMFLNRKGL